jgi:L-2-hydroxyglutarate oxidase LhgO
LRTVVEKVECMVVGAGVVGLAVARELALARREVVVLEAAGAIGTGISARSSEVIHAGLYYPPGSLRGQLCRRGRELLYAYCETNGIAHGRPGKLVVATCDGEVAWLSTLRDKALANGVDDVRLLDRTQALALEPELKVEAALWSPSTGIVDSHGLMLALRGDIEAAGGAVALRTPFTGASVSPSGGFTVSTGGAEPMTLDCQVLVNAAGLDAPAVAGTIAGLPPSSIPAHGLAKGNYFVSTRRVPFSHLIYPVPVPGGLGIHLTLDLAGQGRFGPDVEWTGLRDTQVDPARQAAFEAAVRRYWPGLPDGWLQPGYAGLRPKLHGPDEPAADFLIQGPPDHGIPGLVNLYGIESPGLTSCLAIGQYVTAGLAMGLVRA